MTFGGLKNGQVNNPDGRSGSYEIRPCPMCGQQVKQLPQHFRHQCPEVDR